MRWTSFAPRPSLAVHTARLSEEVRGRDVELFAVGEEVHIPGFAAARIEAYVRGGRHDGRVRVRYRDGSTYHVDPKVIEVIDPPSRMMRSPSS